MHEVEEGFKPSVNRISFTQGEREREMVFKNSAVLVVVRNIHFRSGVLSMKCSSEQ